MKIFAKKMKSYGITKTPREKGKHMDTNKLLEIIEEMMKCKGGNYPRACKEYFDGYDDGYHDALKDVMHEIKCRATA